MPIQRHEAIFPLSRHHHHALALVLKIRKCGEHPQREKIDALKSELSQFWETAGRGHFREEEEILLPAYARYASVDRPEIIGMLLEHVQIRAIVAAIELEADEVLPLIRRLADMLEEHVRKEERIIFPLIEATLPEEELRKLAPYLHEYPRACSAPVPDQADDGKLV